MKNQDQLNQNFYLDKMELREQLKIAEEIAREVHKGQKRPIGNEDYITHPEEVAKLVGNDYALKIVAWLHDVLEDSNLHGGNLLGKGISTYLINSVELLTRKKDQNYKDYILGIKENEIAIKVKIADLEDNLFDLKDGPQKDKYELALLFLKSKLEENENE